MRRVTFTGAALAVIYAVVFMAAYADYRHHAGEWFADLGVVLLVLPFTLTMSLLTGGGFNLTGEQTLSLLLGAAFCCALAWAVGFILERTTLAALRAVLRRRSLPPSA